MAFTIARPGRRLPGLERCAVESPFSPHRIRSLIFYFRLSTFQITGSYNFSRSAQFNAENILFIDSAPLAERYSRYIDHVIAKYR
jgi:hypothetical protein